MGFKTHSSFAFKTHSVIEKRKNMTENNLSKDELNALSANNLAYLGDCVYELYVRE